MPKVTIIQDDTSGSGSEFNPDQWTLTVDNHELTEKYIRLAICEEYAGSLYHEMRHAEQFFAM